MPATSMDPGKNQSPYGALRHCAGSTCRTCLGMKRGSCKHCWRLPCKRCKQRPAFVCTYPRSSLHHLEFVIPPSVIHALQEAAEVEAATRVADAQRREEERSHWTWQPLAAAAAAHQQEAYIDAGVAEMTPAGLRDELTR
jgi:hypothetical protein